MKEYGGVDVYIHIFLTSALTGGEWSALGPHRFTLGETPGSHRIGGWIHPRAGPDDVKKRKFLDSNFVTTVVQPVASHYTDCAIPALIMFTIFT
jgi:hypothetical protein